MPTKTIYTKKANQFDLFFNSTSCAGQNTEIYLNYNDYYATTGVQIDVIPQESVEFIQRSPDMNWVFLKVKQEYQKGQNIHVKVSQKK